MAYTGKYTTKISDLVGQIENSKYVNQYENQIKDTANKIANYGDYTSKYASDIANTANAIKNYGDYKGTYADQISDLSNQISNWNYDPESDVSYQAYKKQYTGLGETAMKNTLGQVSARTGGMASSYASSAANQSYNDYMQQLANIIPTLENNAYNRVNNTLSTLNGLDSTEYSRWSDQLNNLYNQNNMYQNLDSTDYSRWSDKLSNLYNQNNMYMDMDQNDLSHYTQNYNQMQNLLSNYRELDDDEYQRYQDELAAAASASKSSGKSGGGGNDDDGGDDPKYTMIKYKNMTKAGRDIADLMDSDLTFDYDHVLDLINALPEDTTVQRNTKYTLSYVADSMA